eukprot:Skav229405  [mRNA]  locus=scaffold2297:47027:52365:+ [translate_table: standard]
MSDSCPPHWNHFVVDTSVLAVADRILLVRFLVTWEHMTSLRLETKSTLPKGAPKAAPAFGRAENLSIWALTRRPKEPKEMEVKIVKDRELMGAPVLGVNEVTSLEAQKLAEEIQRASSLQLRVPLGWLGGEEVLLDVHWCRGGNGVRRILTLLGPQPATVAMVLYAPGSCGLVVPVMD